MEQIIKYFNAEKGESVFFVLVGIVAIILSTTGANRHFGSMAGALVN